VLETQVQLKCVDMLLLPVPLRIGGMLLRVGRLELMQQLQ
jgi:hypothetical protein